MSNDSTVSGTKADLLVKINNLQRDKDELIEELYESGVRSRPTLLSKIQAIESEAIETIQFIHEKCMKQTGRSIPGLVIPITPTVKTIQLPAGTPEWNRGN